MKTFYALMTVGAAFHRLRGASRGLTGALATNSQEARETQGAGYSMAVNAEVASIEAQDGEGWIQLAPYGETVYLQPEDGRVKRYQQIFQRDQAAKMAAAFNAQAMKRGDHFRGLPVYIGHPDADPVRWTDERRVGSVKALDAREDGLYVKVAWNDLGEQNRQQGYFPYPSPAWMHSPDEARRTGKIVPDELRSVGLVNNPRIQEVPAWTNSTPTSDHTDPVMLPLKIKLLKLLGLPETTTDEALATAFNAAVPDDADYTLDSLRTLATNFSSVESARATAQGSLETAQASVRTLTTERDGAMAQVGSLRTLATNALLDAATNDGRLTAAERAGFEKQFATNFDAAATALKAKTKALPNDPLVLPKLKSGADLSTERSRRLAFNAKVDELIGTKGLAYPAAVEAMKTDPEGKAILEAMQEADKATAAKSAA